MKPKFSIKKHYLFFILIGFFIFASAGCQKNIDIKCQNSDNCQEVSPYIALAVEFSAPVDRELVEKAWFIEPHHPGLWIWKNDNQVLWLSENPYPPHQNVKMGFKRARLGFKGEYIAEDTIWNAVIRQPSILFTAPIDEGQELFLVNIDDVGVRTQLTNTEGNLKEYAASYDGERIAISLINPEGGVDIWIWTRQDNKMELILDCGTAICDSPSWSPNGLELAYSKELPVDSGQTSYPIPQIMIFNTVTGENSTLISGINSYGFNPEWSPDGSWVSYWIGLGKGIEVINRINGASFHLESNSGDNGCWSPDSQSIFFSDLIDIDENNHIETILSAIYRANLAEGKISLMMGGWNEPQGLSYQHPVCHPGGNGLAIYVQPSMHIPGRALWWVSETGEKKETIYDDMSVTVSHTSWDTTGKQLLFSVYALSSGDTGADVMVWDTQQTSPPKLITHGVFQPAWLP